MKITLRVLNFFDGKLTTDPAGCEVPETVPVALSATFNMFNAFGEAKLTKGAEGVDAEFDLPNWLASRIKDSKEKLYPSVGGVIFELVGTKATKSKVLCICLDKANNQDPFIQPVVVP